MMRNLNSIRSGWLALALLLFLSASSGLQAGGGRESSDWNAAISSFKQSAWSRAERELGDFTNRFPESLHFAEAVLYQAEARFWQKKYNEAADLLIAQQGRAGDKADGFTFWLGQAHYYNSNFQAAADSFNGLIRN